MSDTVCTWGEPGSVKLLLGAGADVHVLGHQAACLLFNAVMDRNVGVVAMLIEAGPPLTR